MDFKPIFKGIIDLFYPETCAGCAISLTDQEYGICVRCLAKLPLTDFHEYQENPVYISLSLKIPITAASSALYFKKGNLVQKILHEIKYKNAWKAARILGRYYGNLLTDKDFFKEIDLIIPVPIHHKRLEKRGFNQSEEFALGLSEVLQIEVDTTSLIRQKNSESQSHKSREERFDLLKGDFKILREDKIRNRRVLLVDDLITTGATLEACGQLILSISGTTLKISTLAYTII
jgi:ComF family protein